MRPLDGKPGVSYAEEVWLRKQSEGEFRHIKLFNLVETLKNRQGYVIGISLDTDNRLYRAHLHTHAPGVCDPKKPFSAVLSSLRVLGSAAPALRPHLHAQSVSFLTAQRQRIQRRADNPNGREEQEDFSSAPQQSAPKAKPRPKRKPKTKAKGKAKTKQSKQKKTESASSEPSPQQTHALKKEISALKQALRREKRKRAPKAADTPKAKRSKVTATEQPASNAPTDSDKPASQPPVRAPKPKPMDEAPDAAPAHAPPPRSQTPDAAMPHPETHAYAHSHAHSHAHLHAHPHAHSHTQFGSHFAPHHPHTHGHAHHPFAHAHTHSHCLGACSCDQCPVQTTCPDCMCDE